MEQKKNYVVGNFSYSSEKDALTAFQEQEKIDKLEEKMDYSQPQLVFSVYQKILQGNMFHTQQGILYLVHLQEYLYSCNYDKVSEIPAIPTDLLDFLPVADGQTYTEEQKKEKSNRANTKKGKAIQKRTKQAKMEEELQVSRIIIFFLAVMVIIMLILASRGNSPTILNYKKQIQNEYVEWQQQLSEKEEELRNWERELEQRERELKEAGGEKKD